MGRSDRLQYLILCIGLLVASVLLIRFAIDFSNEMAPLFAAPFWVLVLAALSIASINLFLNKTGKRTDEPARRGRAVLLIAIPLGFLASTLDCMGLTLLGCTSYCTFVKLAWLPLLTLVCAAYLIRRNVWLGTVIALMSFVPLVPHCVCYNPGNGWWIDRLGASPVCYSWGFVVSMISIGALRPGALFWPSIGVVYAIITGAIGFFITHHYLHFPW
ncbi:MAG TPA: hypothetical protein VF131_17480 [Blastocatellia bacterium]|nr:hypothetical protein [Blastocatellia bacterium]